MKAHVAKSDDPSLIPGTHTEEEETWLYKIDSDFNREILMSPLTADICISSPKLETG